MNAIANKACLGLVVTTVLAGCMAPPVQSRAPSSDGTLSSADWARMIESDRASVRAHQLPPEVIGYDLEIEKMLPEGQQIIATHDQARARIWSKKMHAIMDARNEATRKFSAKEIAKNNAIANALGNGRPDPCLSPMGKNTCASAPSQQQPGTIHYTVGPGGLGAVF
ncbi:hypothetical protein [Burkholderia alba]|uniref:hypothetical protein n=1 Tax=Burkholderia alba TaxID=2683677 RepID=UPI002B056D3A|nr:hypothetical protein [Burkholderia alba]